MNREIRTLLFVFCSVKLALHLMADFHSGFQGDELLHIETGNHLDFGFMEFPPLIGFLAFIQNLFRSDSVFIHHIFAHAASISFYTWAPTGEMPRVLIAFSYGDAGIDFFQPFFEEIKPVRKIYNPYADEESKLWQTIYVCKYPRQDFDTMKLLFKKRIFE